MFYTGIICTEGVHQVVADQAAEMSRHLLKSATVDCQDMCSIAVRMGSMAVCNQIDTNAPRVAACSGAAPVQLLRRGRPLWSAAAWGLALALTAVAVGAGAAVLLIGRRQRAAGIAGAVPGDAATGHPAAAPSSQQVAPAPAAAAAGADSPVAGPIASPLTTAPTTSVVSPAAAAARSCLAGPAAAIAPAASAAGPAAAAGASPGNDQQALSMLGTLRLWAESLQAWWTAEAACDAHRAGITLAPRRLSA